METYFVTVRTEHPLSNYVVVAEGMTEDGAQRLADDLIADGWFDARIEPERPFTTRASRRVRELVEV